MATVTVKVTVEVPEAIVERFENGRKRVRLDNYIGTYTNVKREVIEGIIEIAEQFGN